MSKNKASTWDNITDKLGTEKILKLIAETEHDNIEDNILKK